MLYRAVIRPLLFLLSAETAHRIAVAMMAWLARVPGGLRLLALCCGAPDRALRVHAFGRELSSPLGLAAGLDKDAEAFTSFACLGFGSVEVGTITALAQPGNPRPRLFRLRADRALINRMGFNNAGAAAVAARLGETKPRRGVVGINIGKTKLVAAEHSIADYERSANLLGPHADYLVVNVSSPNTPGLRDLQAVDRLRPLLVAVRAALDAATGPGASPVPLLVKIAPDLADTDIDAITDLALELGLSGLVAVNTTLTRPATLRTPSERIQRCGEGGLSGAPLRERAVAVLRRIRARAGDRLLLVSVGGVESAADVWARWCAGATIIQVYTALVYEGPGLVRRLHAGLLDQLKAGGFATLEEARRRSDQGFLAEPPTFFR
jgi:dihydroorotate dehydrogenase